jgi:hypothetical protein
MGDEFARAVAELTSLVGREDALCWPFLELLPVGGASISTLGTVLGVETVSASDGQAARLDEIQFDLGEGPCWDAMTHAAAVLEPDIRNAPQRTWPAFSRAIQHENVGALFAFPLALGPLRFGAIDLYAPEPVTLSDRHNQQAMSLAKVVSRMLIMRALRQAGTFPEADPNPYSRRIVHQATGIVVAQLELSAADALLVIEGHAYATSRSVKDVAEDIVGRRLNFSTDATGIEDSDE